MMKAINLDIEQVRTDYTGKNLLKWNDYIYMTGTLSSKDFGKDLKDLLDWIYENKHQLQHVMGEYDLVVHYTEEYDTELEAIYDEIQEAKKNADAGLQHELEEKADEFQEKTLDKELLRVDLTAMVKRNPAKSEFTSLYAKIIALANKEMSEDNE